jgi:hypothetical protein
MCKTAKYNLLIPFIFLFVINAHAIKPGKKISNLHIYSFSLPIDTQYAQQVTASILYKGKQIIAKSIKSKNGMTAIQNKFIYLQNASNKIGTVTLPFYLPANHYYWITTTDMVIQQAQSDNTAFKIKISSNNATLKNMYQLPEKFDLISANALNITYLQNAKPKQRDSILDLHCWILNLSIQQKIIKDTLITYSLRNPLPLGIQQLLQDEIAADGGTFNYQSGYYFNQTLYYPIHNSSIKYNYIFITNKGKVCAAKPCKYISSIQQCNQEMIQEKNKISITLNLEK